MKPDRAQRGIQGGHMGGRGWVASVGRGISEEDLADLMESQNCAFFEASGPC